MSTGANHHTRRVEHEQRREQEQVHELVEVSDLLEQVATGRQQQERDHEEPLAEQLRAQSGDGDHREQVRRGSRTPPPRTTSTRRGGPSTNGRSTVPTRKRRRKPSVIETDISVTDQRFGIRKPVYAAMQQRDREQRGGDPRREPREAVLGRTAPPPRRATAANVPPLPRRVPRLSAMLFEQRFWPLHRRRDR